jgi:para-nitrobenzyl esterase
VVDGRHIFHAPMSPEGIAMQASIPGILSRTATEATPWLISDRRNLQVTAEQLRTRLEAQYGLDDAAAAAIIKDFRRDDPNRTPWDVLVAVASEALIRSPMRHAAEARSRAEGAPVYLCDFNWKSPFDGGIWGTPHAIDIPFAFGTLDTNRMTAGTGAGAGEASRNLMSAYVAFARTGSPDNRRIPQWKPYDIATRPTMVFDNVSRLVNDFRSGDRRTSDRLSQQPTFQLMSGPLFRYSA